MIKYLQFISILVFFPIQFVFAQSIEISDQIKWNGLIKEYTDSGTLSVNLSFNGAYTDPTSNLPQYWKTIPIQNEHDILIPKFTTLTYAPCTAEESEFLSEMDYSQDSVIITSSVAFVRKAPQCVLSFIPIRKNSKTGIFEKLISFNLTVEINACGKLKKNQSRMYKENSVLNDGKWFKIRLKQSGIYKIDYDDLTNYGMNPDNINPKNIRIYGNGMGMLPEKNNIFRYDDLQENAIYVAGQEDGIFNMQDYILFFGMSPHTWVNNQGFFTYEANLYDDYNYYYITTSLGEGIRLQNEPSVTLTPNHTTDKYNDYKVVEDEAVNLILSGKEWYGDIFNTILNREYIFDFSDINANEPAVIKIEIANRTFKNEIMAIAINDQINDTAILTSVNPQSYKYAQKKKKTIEIFPSGGEIKVRLEYYPGTPSSIAWLDYIMINTICHLNYHSGQQLLFRDLSGADPGTISNFRITNAVQELEVWEITNPLLPKIVETDVTEDELTFTLLTDSLREFIAFDGSYYLIPEFVEEVKNQNLHAEGPYDVIIVSYPLFLDHAYELADIHASRDSFAIKVVTPAEIYNEFSSGKQDPSAIRDYVKMFYDKYQGHEPRFLILFGDGSFDPKDRIENNSNFVPTFQTEESLISASSYVIDDYFGYLDDTEGEDASGALDIGIGRIPVQTVEEAQIVLDKIRRYISTGNPSYGEWRNRLCFIADDEDGNLHLEQTDSITNQNGLIPALYNQQKIYLDAYNQVRTPTGYRYPDVNLALNKAVSEGALFINYVGHGGKAGWAYERILQSADIHSWKNTDRLPVFITASCEFSRFDDPEIKSGGELVLLNPEGGGIGLFTTTRLAYSQSNFTLNQNVYLTAFSRINGEYPYFGDIIERSKPPGQPTTRNFVLIGDPALKLAYSSYEVRTISIKNLQTDTPSDTLHALDMAEISGEIADYTGNLIESFNGIVQVTLFDKKTRYITRGNDQYSFPVEFFCQDKIIWQGNASVVNGKFKISLIVPKDISYEMGPGKISYYAWSDQFDASGFDTGISIGGINTNAETDQVGPDINLYLNDTSFISGDQTHNNPLMIAFLSDKSGINLSDGGIGHEITAVLDDDHSNVLILNDYFVQDLDDYKSGSIEYQYTSLSDGFHTLTLKAWDNYNNSSEKTISFVINLHGTLELSKVTNCPNPFKTSTTFTFHHTRPGDQLEVFLEIFDLAGERVLSLSNNIYTENTEADFYTWNGEDQKGNKLRSGVYLYTLKVTDEDGNTTLHHQKLVLLN